MRKNHKNKGFSLTEVLMAMGILTTAMMFIGGVFPVALHFTKTATERTIAAVVADEAFAKIKLYGLNTKHPDLLTGKLVPFETVAPASVQPLPDSEFAYPSAATGTKQKQYYWSALCKHLAGGSVQVTVFVSRKIGGGQNYRTRQTIYDPPVANSPYPKPIPIAFTWPGGNILLITDHHNDSINEENFVNDGYTIVDSQTGQIYRVDERSAHIPGSDQSKRIRISGDILPSSGGEFWVVPSAAEGGRYPCVAVYQKVIRF